MLQKYNLAYLPNSDLAKFIHYAESLSQSLKTDTYLLGVNSLPHVSICQFEIQKNKIESIWTQVDALNLPQLDLTFNEQRFKTYRINSKWDGLYWISLIPDKLDELTLIHYELAKIIKTPLNAAFAKYDPHLTLFNSYDEAVNTHLTQISQIKPPLKEKFKLVLGEIDNVGQVTKILFM